MRNEIEFLDLLNNSRQKYLGTLEYSIKRIILCKGQVYSLSIPITQHTKP